MKKFFTYILISILVGVFVPIFVALAVDPIGSCVEQLAAGVQGPPQTFTGITQAACTAKGANWKWTVEAAVPTGDCVQKLAAGDVGPAQTIPNMTQSACQAKGAGWEWKQGGGTPPISGSYNILAPLPDGKGGMSPTTFDATGKGGGALGSYLNLMVTLFIGICAVLAVIMIVLGGIEYMTTELISSKEAGKDRIVHAILGLLLALGAYLILYTINPEILKTDLSSLQDVTITVMDDSETVASSLSSDDSISSEIAPLCPEGIVPTASGIPACRRIAQQFDAMIAAATLAGKNISGYGYRSVERQKQLRIENCNGDFTNRNAPCSPLTALPGASNHNNGLAFDLKCDGVKIQNTTNACFVWLKNNAGTYGLRNLPAEPWHWSVDGH
jgi:hypothetical protein